MTKKWQQPSVPHVLAKTLFMVNIYINKAVTRRVHFPSHMNQDREGIQTRGAYGPAYLLSPNVHTQHTHTNTNITCTTHSTHTQTSHKIHTNTHEHQHTPTPHTHTHTLLSGESWQRAFSITLSWLDSSDVERWGHGKSWPVSDAVYLQEASRARSPPLLRPLCPTQRVQTSQLNSTCASC